MARRPEVAEPGGRRDRRPSGGLFGRWLRGDAAAGRHAGEASTDGDGAVEVDIVDQAEAFASLRVSEVMTPRADILALEVSLPLSEVARRFVESEHSRMPVYREGLDDPIGVVHLKDMVRLIAPPEGATPPWAEPVLHKLRRELLYVPGSMRAQDLLLKMRAARTHMALVIDEFGGTDGLVTLEDLVEAVVGEISDEHDEEEAAHIVERPGGVLEADARAPLAELEARLGHALPPPDADEEVDTVGGLVAALAGRLPQRGEVIVHPGGVEFEVVESDPRRIRQLRIRPAHPNIAPEALTPSADEPAGPDVAEDSSDR
jgi:CBS domain containing-hemolysin-like protein